MMLLIDSNYIKYVIIFHVIYLFIAIILFCNKLALLKSISAGWSAVADIIQELHLCPLKYKKLESSLANYCCLKINIMASL